MKIVTINIKSLSPLLQACDKLADPLDEATIAHKKLTAIRGNSKTQEVIIAIAKSQYINSLYYSSENGVFIPSVNIKKCMEEGAKLSRNGDKVRKGVMILDNEIKLHYGENLTPQELWESGNKYMDKRSVVVSKAKVICYRPKFTNWSIMFNVHYDEDIIEAIGILDYLNAAGAYIGLGGFRPSKNGMFGRFEAKLEKS